MRCWHYKLIPYLPRTQLLAQWRELNSIFKKQDKHILINYVYEYNIQELNYYTDLVINEMGKRNIKIKNWTNYNDVFNEPTNIKLQPFKKHHTKQYLLQCFMNLEEKYFCGQIDFDRATYLKLWNFVNDELNGLLQIISNELKEE
jgi:uncharacterized protein (TIGR02328 family)